MANYIATTEQFTATANAIRAKTGASGTLEWDASTGYADDIAAISAGIDTSDATAAAGDILAGKTAYVNGSKVTGNIATKTASNLSASGKTVTVPAGYYASQATKDVATTTHPNPILSIDSSTGVVTATHEQTTGYVTGGTTTGTLSLAFKPAATFMPGIVDQTISSGQYLTGAQTIKGDANLLSENIAEGVSIFGVTGTHAGGGGDDALDAFLTGEISSCTNSRITKLRKNVFYSCSRLTTVSFPSCTSIEDYAFYFCSRLATVSFPLCTSISAYAFASCSNLTTASFPLCTSINTAAFGNCAILATVSFPKCTNIAANVFYYCVALATVSFPSCTSISANAFAYCTNLTTASFPLCTNIVASAFRDCAKLTTVSFPKCKNIGNFAFGNCTSLATASFPSCTSISSSAFYKCYKLLSLYLYNTVVASLGHINAFSSTPISNYTTSTGGRYGSIFVKSSLLTSWKTATNWTTYSSRFVGK